MLIVAPLAGAWIEIAIRWSIHNDGILSLPSRERGLKCSFCRNCAGAKGRSPRGSVD